MDACHDSGVQNDLVVSLPHDLAVRLLGSWLTLNDIAHLDSAICNHIKRGSFLSLVSSNELIFDGISLEHLIAMCDRTSKLPVINDYLWWLYAKRVKVLELSLMGGSFEGVMLMKYLRMNGLSIPASEI